MSGTDWLPGLIVELYIKTLCYVQYVSTCESVDVECIHAYTCKCTYKVETVTGTDWLPGLIVEMYIKLKHCAMCSKSVHVRV